MAVVVFVYSCKHLPISETINFYASHFKLFIKIMITYVCMCKVLREKEYFFYLLIMFSFIY